ncbi:MAG: hypothetical protein RQ743_14060 [Bacteroidales bacterium]|nr:hypothetical protein [Bacteroidales bacterium]
MEPRKVCNTRVLTVVTVGTTPKHRNRQDVAVWSGSENTSEIELGKHGNTGEPNVSTRKVAGKVNRINKRPG